CSTATGWPRAASTRVRNWPPCAPRSRNAPPHDIPRPAQLPVAAGTRRSTATRAPAGGPGPGIDLAVPARATRRRPGAADGTAHRLRSCAAGQPVRAPLADRSRARRPTAGFAARARRPACRGEGTTLAVEPARRVVELAGAGPARACRPAPRGTCGVQRTRAGGRRSRPGAPADPALLARRRRPPGDPGTGDHPRPAQAAPERGDLPHAGTGP